MATHRASGPRARRGARRPALRVAWLAALLATGCAPRATEPNLVFITLDTTRADHLGLYGYFRDTSPGLDAFGKQAIVFERAIVPMATTLPTHTSIFSGLHPIEHGVLANGTESGSRYIPALRLQLLAEVARAAGWRTAAFVSAGPLKRGSGIEKGFERFDEPEAEERDAEAVTAPALAWLESSAQAPFLLWVHYFDAHWPYEPPAPYATLFGDDAKLAAAIAERRIPRTVFRPIPRTFEETADSINLYDGELRYQDFHVARLLAALAARPDWERTLVVIAGDHGEGLGQHGIAAHGEAWDEQLHAPLLLRLPGEAPRRIGTPVALVDLLPTLLARLPSPAFDALRAQASGRDVLVDDLHALPILSQTQNEGRLRVVAQRRLALTTSRWKYFRVEKSGEAARNELFDLDADPYELTDVAAQHPEVTAELASAAELALEVQRRKAQELNDGKQPALSAPDPALREQLRALGYVDEEPAPR